MSIPEQKPWKEEKDLKSIIQTEVNGAYRNENHKIYRKTATLNLLDDAYPHR